MNEHCVVPVTSKENDQSQSNKNSNVQKRSILGKVVYINFYKCIFSLKYEVLTKIYFSAPTRRRQTRALKKDALQYLTGKHELENKIKLKELEIEEKKVANESRRLDLEERKFDFDCQERNQKMLIEREKAKMDLEERQTLRNLLNSQQKIIESLLMKFKN